MAFKIHLIVAARPNFMKIAPLYHVLRQCEWADPILIHTGQHYDVNMSDAFFKDLNLPEPDIHLGVGSGSHAEQTGQVMAVYEKILVDQRPHLIVVVGDVNSTLACTLAAAKIAYRPELSLPADLSDGSASRPPRTLLRPIIAHLEAGLRSFDRTMPEEVNRIVTDILADMLWTPSPDGDDNLLKEGIPKEKILRVGNIMIDSLEMLRKKIETENTYQRHGLVDKGYGVVTLHRPSNVDDPVTLKTGCEILYRISQNMPLVFPIHPRTRKNLEQTGLLPLLADSEKLLLLDPLSYVQFMNLVFHSRFVITDSGGIQEETTYLGIPCLTLRPNTERPITITQGTNQLCPLPDLEEAAARVLSRKNTRGEVPEHWDGKTAERVASSIYRLLHGSSDISSPRAAIKATGL